jgi:rhodanese-related sulfurtransferase
MTYAGDISPAEAWTLLEKEPEAVLIDVRTRPEWTYVGVPDLGALGKETMLISWQVFPANAVNQDFVPQLSRAVPDQGRALIFLCRSGARSRAAAQAMTAAGYKRCYNVATGFEGAADEKHHRGRVAGWKADGLPWIQE